MHGTVAPQRRLTELLTIVDVQRVLNINSRTLYRLAKEGNVPAVRVGRQWRFRQSDLEAWLETKSLHTEQRDRTVTSGALPDVPPPDEGTPVSLGRILLADRDHRTVDQLAGALASTGFAIEVAPDATAALAMLGGQQLRPAHHGNQHARARWPGAHRRRPPPSARPAGHRDHRELDGGCGDRGREPRRGRVLHQAPGDVPRDGGGAGCAGGVGGHPPFMGDPPTPSPCQAAPVRAGCRCRRPPGRARLPPPAADRPAATRSAGAAAAPPESARLSLRAGPLRRSSGR